ncbi:MAG: tRNA epoxyqueuosine(34) reductase QueG [Flavobacteriales bacterium]|nr:tRNA epoxyqueuosine(34) reductase QueG [Flavobacteriales bacterium]
MNASDEIKAMSLKHGFSYCGIARAEFLEEEAVQLDRWLKKGMHGEMSYMERHFDKRLDPRLLVPGAKSVISLLFNYYSGEGQSENNVPRISKYAFGEDYHFVVKDKLHLFLADIKFRFGDIAGRVFVDSAPVMDKAWARRGGLGWIGKNSNILRKGEGSFFFIAELILDLDLEFDGPATDHCGTCTACIDACPTEAIVEPYVVDGSKCISYFTIELKNAIPESQKGKFENWAFGCDICQDVCPWNRFSRKHTEPRFEPKEGLMSLTKNQWVEMTEELFDEWFVDSPLQRAGYEGLKRNVKFVTE